MSQYSWLASTFFRNSAISVSGQPNWPSSLFSSASQSVISSRLVWQISSQALQCMHMKALTASSRVTGAPARSFLARAILPLAVTASFWVTR